MIDGDRYSFADAFGDLLSGLVMWAMLIVTTLLLVFGVFAVAALVEVLT